MPTKFALHLNENYLDALRGLIGESEEVDMFRDLFLLIELTGPAEFNAKFVAADHLCDEEGDLLEDIQIVAV